MKIASGVYSVPAVSACVDFSCDSYYSFFSLFGFATPTLVLVDFEGAVAASHVASAAAAPLLAFGAALVAFSVAAAALVAFVAARDTALLNCAADVCLK